VKRFQRILVGVDLALSGERLTFGSERALEQGLFLATRTGAELVFLHSSWADLHEQDQAIHPGPGPEGTAVLEGLVERARAAGLASELVLARDRAWMELIRTVQRGRADLVVVGRHDSSEGGAYLGGVSKKLLRKCPCPVWVVKPEGRVDPQAVVAATDLTAVGDLAVELAASVAELTGGELHVVHAWPLPLRLPVSSELELPSATREEILQLERAAEARFKERLGARHLVRAPHTHLACGAPSVVVRDLVERVGAELLVMGSVSRGGIAGLLLGNTAERLLDRVPCSLLTIKPGDFVTPVAAP